MRVLFMFMVIMSVGAASTFSQTISAEQFFKEGTALAKAEKYEQAILSYRSSYDLVRNDKELKSKIQYNIGSCFYQLEKFDSAEKSFRKAVRLNKKYVQAIYSLGLTQIELKKIKTAELNFRKVLRLDRNHAEAWFDLGMVLLERKMYGNARIAFQKSIEHKTTRSAEARNNLGAISALNGDIEFAILQFRQAFYESNGTLLLASRNIEFLTKYRRFEPAQEIAVN